MTEPSQWAILTACSKNSFVMVLLILHVCFRLCVSFSKCLCGLHLRMYVYGCVCAHVCMSLQRHIHGIMSCRAGRCQGIWLRRNCSAVVISVFLAGIMLKTKNDWNDSDLPAWSAGLPLTTAWKYRLQHSVVTAHMSRGGNEKRPHTEPSTIQQVELPPEKLAHNVLEL